MSGTRGGALTAYNRGQWLGWEMGDLCMLFADSALSD